MRVTATWVCPEGHVSRGTEAFRVTSLSSGVKTGNICPTCYVEWIAANVPEVEEACSHGRLLSGPCAECMALPENQPEAIVDG